MSQMNRPENIIEILKNIDKPHKSEDTAVLEAYLAELETNLPDRPVHIVAILKTIETHYTTDTGIALDTYITNLESKRQTTLSDKSHIAIVNAKQSPQWSHNRRVQLEKRRRERIKRKRHNNS